MNVPDLFCNINTRNLSHVNGENEQVERAFRAFMGGSRCTGKRIRFLISGVVRGGLTYDRAALPEKALAISGDTS